MRAKKGLVSRCRRVQSRNSHRIACLQTAALSKTTYRPAHCLFPTTPPRLPDGGLGARPAGCTALHQDAALSFQIVVAMPACMCFEGRRPLPFDRGANSRNSDSSSSNKAGAGFLLRRKPGQSPSSLRPGLS